MRGKFLDITVDRQDIAGIDTTGHAEIGVDNVPLQATTMRSSPKHKRRDRWLRPRARHRSDRTRGMSSAAWGTGSRPRAPIRRSRGYPRRNHFDHGSRRVFLRQHHPHLTQAADERSRTEIAGGRMGRTVTRHVRRKAKRVTGLEPLVAALAQDRSHRPFARTPACHSPCSVPGDPKVGEPRVRHR